MESEINLKQDIEESWLTFLSGYLLVVVFQSESFHMQDSYVQRALAEAEKYKRQSAVGDSELLDEAKLARLRPLTVKAFPDLVLRCTLTLVVSEFETFLQDCIEKILKHGKEIEKKKTPKNFHDRFNFLTGDPLRIDPDFPSNKPFVREELYEIHATRNILVHNQGIVDQKYVLHSESAQFKIGTERPITEEYVKASCNTIFNTVVHLCIAISDRYSAETS